MQMVSPATLLIESLGGDRTKLHPNATDRRLFQDFRERCPKGLARSVVGLWTQIADLGLARYAEACGTYLNRLDYHRYCSWTLPRQPEGGRMSGGGPYPFDVTRLLYRRCDRRFIDMVLLHRRISSRKEGKQIIFPYTSEPKFMRDGRALAQRPLSLWRARSSEMLLELRRQRTLFRTLDA